MNKLLFLKALRANDASLRYVAMAYRNVMTQRRTARSALSKQMHLIGKGLKATERHQGFKLAFRLRARMKPTRSKRDEKQASERAKTQASKQDEKQAKQKANPKKAADMQVLIVEDDIRLAQALGQILEENHYQVDLVHDGVQGLEYIKVGSYDVVILDVMLPRKSGLAIVQEIRREGIDVPVLMLTARTTVQDKITGFDSGADDYMTKPFSPAELLAHLRALTRRQGQVVFEKVEFGDVSLNLESHDLSCGQKTINLSYKEFSIVNILMAAKGQITSKESLISKVWGIESSAVDNNVEAYISFIRKKLKFLGSKTQIETVRKVGYRLVAPQSEK